MYCYERWSLCDRSVPPLGDQVSAEPFLSEVCICPGLWLAFVGPNLHNAGVNVARLSLRSCQDLELDTPISERPDRVEDNVNILVSLNSKRISSAAFQRQTTWYRWNDLH